MAFIKALTYYVPETVVGNGELQNSLLNVEVEKIAKGVGVVERHIANADMTAGDMATMAAKKLFQDNSIVPEDIDFIIFSTQSPDHFLPPTACLIQNRLGIPTSAGAFDYDLGCSGYVYGLAIANSFVESGLAKNVLLLTGDTITRFMNKEDSNRVLFGEAASATLVTTEGIAEIGQFEKGTDGSGADLLMVKNRAARCLECTGHEEIDVEGNLRRDDFFYMNGNAVFNFTVERVPLLISGTLAANNLSQDSIDYYVFHQANRFMLNTIRKICGLPKDKFYVNIEHTGNTTSSTVPIGLTECLKNGTIHCGMKIMVAGFGVGLSWAGTVLTFK